MTSGGIGPSLVDLILLGSLILAALVALVGAVFCLYKRRWLAFALCAVVATPGMILVALNVSKEAKFRAANEIYQSRELTYTELSLFTAEYLRQHPNLIPAVTEVREVQIDGLAQAISSSSLIATTKITVENGNILDSFKQPYRFFWSPDKTVVYHAPFSRSTFDQDGYDPHLIISDASGKSHCWRISRSDLQRMNATPWEPKYEK